MRRLLQFSLGVLLAPLLLLPAQAAFSSFYTFGDSVSTTTDNPTSPYYYGNRYSNGRVWVEVLAQRQGVNYDPNKNWSYYGNYSSNMVQHVTNFVAADISTSLIAIWVANADFVDMVTDANHRPPYVTNSSTMTFWTNYINQSVTNHLRAIQNLYAKGARTFLMPNAVDLSKVPYYQMSASDSAFVRQRVIDFNKRFQATLDLAQATLPGLTLYRPDIFALVDDFIAHPANYGLIKPTTDALEDSSLINKALNGPGTNYVFWDYEDPTAMTHAIVADFMQQLISPPRIKTLTHLSTSNRLDLINVPIGRNGFIEGGASCSSWKTVQTLTSTNVAESVLVPLSGPVQFYRLRFPASYWTWP